MQMFTRYISRYGCRDTWQSKLYTLLSNSAQYWNSENHQI